MPTVWGHKVGPDTLRIYGRHAPALDKFKPGERLRIRVMQQDRNGKFNSLYHLMLSEVAKLVNAGPIPVALDVDALKRWVKRETGRYEIVKLEKPAGGVLHAIEYQSTSFAKMGEEEFHKFAIDTCELIRAKLAPWISDADEWPRVRELVDSILPGEAGT